MNNMKDKAMRKHLRFCQRTIGLLAALSAVAVLSAQTPAKPRVQTSAAPEETAVYKSDGKKEKVAVAASANEKARETKVRKKSAAFGGNRYVALKTNMLYDACGLLNLAAEVQVHKKMTVELPLTVSLWDLSSKHAVRTVELQPEARWWMGKEAGRGHFIGLHAHVAWFNVKWNDNRYQDTDRPLLGAGLSYGYKLPLSEHWGAEFTMGLGYANMKYNTYYNIDNGALLDTRVRHYWGVTKVGASLVYRF